MKTTFIIVFVVAAVAVVIIIVGVYIVIKFHIALGKSQNMLRAQVCCTCCGDTERNFDCFLAGKKKFKTKNIEITSNMSSIYIKIKQIRSSIELEKLLNSKLY